MRILRFIIFISVFITIYLGMHYIVVSRIYSYYHLTHDHLYIWLIIGLGLFFPLAALLEKTMNTPVTRIIYVTASIQMGLLAILLGLLVLYDTLRLVWPHTGVVIPSIVLASALLLTLYGILNGYGFRVKEIHIPLPNLEASTDIVQLSDIHLGTIHGTGYLRQIVDEINRLAPTMVLITGDMFDGSAPVDKKTIRPFDQLAMPVFMSIGNHEIYEGVRDVTSILADTPVRLLRNEKVVSNGLQIIGIDNPTRESRRDIPELSDIDLDPEEPAILMYHPPTGMADARAAGVDLQLAGHTHHGQIWPFSLLVRLFFPYGFGLYHLDGLYLYTSPGTGTWGPPMRIGSKSEITLIHLVPEE